jgi:hypothetical protein
LYASTKSLKVMPMSYWLERSAKTAGVFLRGANPKTEKISNSGCPRRCRQKKRSRKQKNTAWRNWVRSSDSSQKMSCGYSRELPQPTDSARSCSIFRPGCQTSWPIDFSNSEPLAASSRSNSSRRTNRLPQLLRKLAHMPFIGTTPERKRVFRFRKGSRWKSSLDVSAARYFVAAVHRQLFD